MNTSRFLQLWMELVNFGEMRWGAVYTSISLSSPYLQIPVVFSYHNTNILSLQTKKYIASFWESYHCFDALWQGRDEWERG